MKALGSILGGEPPSGFLPKPLHPEDFMRYLQPDNNIQFYVGVDLHARTLFLAILDHQGQTPYARNLAATPKPFLQALTPFQHSILVGCECMRT